MLTFVVAMLVILVLSGSVLVAVAQGEGKLDGLVPDRAPEEEDVVTHV